METSRVFIEDEYPWFLPTYDNYKFPIQRIDVLRYFLLRRYGGLYIDMDNVSFCLARPRRTSPTPCPRTEEHC
jgi:mannosyltransferase OCH1-like enzyme